MTAIAPAYCLMMARYNAWQNRLLRGVLERMTDAALRQERGAWFGSIFGTVNHILWADEVWMSRLEGQDPPERTLAESTEAQPTLAGWSAERFRRDWQLIHWAESLEVDDLLGDLEWFSAAIGTQMRKPKAQCIVHMFNHQTHHRGQVHAMLTQAGERPEDTDLVFMSESGPWL